MLQFPVHMARKHIELSDFFPYHVCARTNNRDWFEIPLEVVFKIFTQVLNKTSQNYELHIHAFVLMANHFHMVVTTPKANLSEAMRYLMTETSRAVARTSHRINRIYGARYRWTIIKSPAHYAHAVKYVYRNPVKAGISKKVELYPWSTILEEGGPIKRSPHPLEFTEYLPPANDDFIKWLNENCGEEHDQRVQAALRRHVFEFPRDKKTGRKPEANVHLRCKNTPGTKDLLATGIYFGMFP
jgi:putative transposase